jgi:hypothetical protein
MVSDSLRCDISFVKPFHGYNTSFKIQWEVEEK